jgi:hypothetical protein
MQSKKSTVYNKVYIVVKCKSQPKLIWLAIISQTNVTQNRTIFKFDTNGEDTGKILLEKN